MKNILAIQNKIKKISGDGFNREEIINKIYDSNNQGAAKLYDSASLLNFKFTDIITGNRRYGKWYWNLDGLNTLTDEQLKLVESLIV
jgi:hypothetical protein